MIVKQANQRVLAFHTDIRWEKDFQFDKKIRLSRFPFVTRSLLVFYEIPEIKIQLTQFQFPSELSEKYKIFQGTSSKWQKFVSWLIAWAIFLHQVSLVANEESLSDADWLSSFFTSPTSKLHSEEKLIECILYFLILFVLFNILLSMLKFWLFQQILTRYEFSNKIIHSKRPFPSWKFLMF